MCSTLNLDELIHPSTTFHRHHHIAAEGTHSSCPQIFLPPKSPFLTSFSPQVPKRQLDEMHHVDIDWLQCLTITDKGHLFPSLVVELRSLKTQTCLREVKTDSYSSFLNFL
jgi:hypothetical protein